MTNKTNFGIFALALLLSLPLASAAACTSSTIVSEGPLGNQDFTTIGTDTSSHSEILRYRLQWFSGYWSEWYTPGVNDLEMAKFNGTLRYWAYFGDHNHEYEKCLSWGNENRAPTISGISGPTSLSIGETGTWAITASDPEGGQLTYSVIWGDEPSGGIVPLAKSLSTGQAATFTHIYYGSGNYYPSFTVTDNGSLAAQTSMSVNVGSTPTPTCTDSDGGIYPYVRGYCTDRNGRHEDAGLSALGEGPREVGVYASEMFCLTNEMRQYCKNSNSAEYCDSLPNDCYSVQLLPPSSGIAYPYFPFKQEYLCTMGFSNGTCVQGEPQPASVSCSEADSGRNYYNPGATTWYSSSGQATTAQDYCSGSNTLVEYYCVNNFDDGGEEAANKSISYNCPSGCSNGACIKPPLAPRQCSAYNITVREGPLGTHAFGTIGLDTSSHPEIIMYRIQWSSGGWSDWYVPGVEDLDWKTHYDVTGKQTRVWAYFGDHTHEYVKCTDSPPSENRAPVISGVSGPASIAVGQSGTWSVTASDPENGALSYSIVWGDEGASWNTPSAARMLSAGQAATFTHTYYGAGNYYPAFTVKDDHGLTAITSMSVRVGAGGCISPNSSTPACAPGYEPYSYYEGVGCLQYGCRKNGERAKIDLEVTADPSTVSLYDTFKVNGKVTYIAGGSSGSAQKFMVVTTYFGGNAYGLSGAKVAAKKSASLSSSDDDLVSRIARILGNRGKSESAPGQVKKNSDESGQEDGSSGTSVVSAVSTTDTSANSQEKTEYITLSPGESATITAYFTARSAGAKHARVSVYQYDSSAGCPETTGGADAYCKSGWKLLAQEQVKITVTSSKGDSTTQLKLYPGWNMVSVPLAGGSISMADVAASCGSRQYAWRLSSTGYEKASVLSQGYGYWIRATQECTVNVQGSSGGQISPPELFAGWNLVAAPESEVSISDYLGTCTLSAGPWHYEYQAGSDPSRSYVFSSKLTPGKAYWIRVPAACKLGGSAEEVPPSPPA